MLFTLVPTTAMAGTEDATELTAQQVLLWNEDASVPVVASGSELNWEFGVNPDNIAGYVTISIEDYAKRFEDSAVKEQKGVILEKTQVPFAVGETAADVTVRLLDYLEIAHEIDYTWGFYIKAMAGLQEGDTAQYSERALSALCRHPKHGKTPDRRDQRHARFARPLHRIHP